MQTWGDKFKEIVRKENFRCVLCGSTSLCTVCYFQRNAAVDNIEFRIYAPMYRDLPVPSSVLEVMTLCESCRLRTSVDFSYYHEKRWGTRKHAHRCVIIAQGLEL